MSQLVTPYVEIFEERRRQCADVLAKLLAAPAVDFDGNLRSRLPVSPGLYLIARKNAPLGEYLHAGQTPRARKGLRSRVWEQHFTGGGKGASSDLVQKVIDKGEADSKANAQAWIRANCVVQWLAEPDEDLRCWTEHYVLSMVRPKWGR